MTTSKQPSKKVTKIANPTVGIDGINHAIRALYAYKDPATYKDLAKAANLHPVYLSKSLSSARDMGLTMSAGKRGLYKLTPEGVEYGRLLSYGKDSECRELLQKVILENPLWSEIIRFLRVSEGRETDPLLLVGDIEGRLGKRWSPSMRNTLVNAYTSILEYAKLIALKGGKMISEIKPEKEIGAPSVPITTTPAPIPTPTPAPLVQVPVTREGGVTLNVNIRLELPATQDATVYDKIFQSLKKHLLTPSSKTD